jgi:hypothetical protein
LIERAIAAHERMQRLVHEQLGHLRAERGRLGRRVGKREGGGLVLAGSTAR